jgi:pyrophosphatase PpaX
LNDKHIIFDLDDTIIRSADAVTNALKSACKTMEKEGLGISADEAYEIFLNIILPEISMINRYDPFLAFKYQVGLEDNLIINAGYKTFLAEVEPIPTYDDVHKNLEKLKSIGFLLSLITNGYLYTQSKKVWGSGIVEYFQDRVFSPMHCHPPYYKPNSRLFNYVMECIGATPETAMMIGDRKMDIVGANLVGMTTVALERIDRGQFDGDLKLVVRRPDYKIQSLDEIYDVLKEMGWV